MIFIIERDGRPIGAMNVDAQETALLLMEAAKTQTSSVEEAADSPHVAENAS